MSALPCFGGMAVAKAQWDMALRPAGDRWAVANEASEGAPRVERRQPLPP